MGRHFFVVLAGNGVGGPFRTLFKHASTLDKVFSVGHWAPPCGVPIRFGRYTLQFAAGSNHRVATWVLAPFRRSARRAFLLLLLGAVIC